MNIIFAPAHYYLSDTLGTEVSWPFYAMQSLAEKGHTVYGICGYTDLTGTLPENVHLSIMYPGKRGTNALVEYGRKVGFYFKVAREVKRLRREHQIDVVHHFAPISAQSPNLSAAVFGGLRGTIFTIGPAMVPGSKSSELGLAMGVKTDWRLKIVSGLLALMAAPLRVLQRRTLRRAQKVIAATDLAAEEYAKLVDDPKKIVVVPPGIRLETYAIKGIKHRHSVVLAVCYLTERKGIDVLLKAFAKVVTRRKSARLWIVGNGPEEANLKKLARTLGISKVVQFWGFVNNTEVGRYYAEAGIFASPTRHEPFGQTLLEAMAAGLPIVASHTGAVPHIVAPGAGFTHPIDDVDAVAEHLNNLLAHPDLIDKMGAKAEAHVRANYAWSTIMDTYLDIWKSLSKK